MAAQNEVELIVRAKNLSTKTTKQINDDLGKIADTQEKVADANKLAERSFESLKSEQQQLLTIMKALNDRAARLNAFEQQEKRVRELRTELSTARGALQQLATQFYNTDKPTKEFEQQLRTAGTQVTRLESNLGKAERRFDQTGRKLQEMGVDVTRFGQSQDQVNAALGNSLNLYRRSTENMERYETAVREVRAEKDREEQAVRETAQAQRDAAAASAQATARERQMAEISANLRRTLAKQTERVEQEAARAREQQLQRERQMAELTTNVYRTLARERERAAKAGSQFRATGSDAATAARSARLPAVGSGSGLAGAAAGVQAALEPAKEAVATFEKLQQAVDQLEKEFAELTPDAIRAGDGMEKLADQSRRLREAAAALKSQASIADELNKQNVALVASQQRFEAARQEVLEYAAAVEKADAPNDELAASLQRAQNEMRQAHAELTRQTEAFNRVEQRARALGITVEKLNGIEGRLASNASRVANGQRQVADAMVRMEQSTDRAGKKLNAFNSGQRTALSLYQRSRGQILSLVSAYVGVFGAINLANSSLDAAIGREKVMSRLMIAVGGDANDAAREYEYLRAKADELGLEFNSLADSYSRFAVASRDAGMSAEATRYIFESFSEASAVLRLSADETEGAFKALEQIFSKGFIQAEELRGQLGDRLTGAFNLFAKAIGVSTQELNKMLEKGGEVRAEFVLLAAQQARGIYGPQAKAASESLLGDMNRMTNAFNDMKRAIVDGGFGEEVRKLFVEITEFLQSDDGETFATDLAKVFAAAAQAGRELVKVLSENEEVITFLADAVSFLIRNFKALLAIMVAIQASRIALVFARITGELIKARAATLAFNAALGTGTAAAAGKAGASITALIGGPIAALIALAAAPIVISIVARFNIDENARKIERKTDDIAKTQERLLGRVATARDASFEENVTLIQDIQKATREAGSEIESLTKQIEENNKQRVASTTGFVGANTKNSPTAQAEISRQAMEAEARQTEQLNSRLASLVERREQLAQLSLRISEGVAGKRAAEGSAQADAFEAEMKRIREAADAAAARAGAGSDKEDGKAKRAQEKLAGDRIRLAEETAKALREIDDDLLKAQDDNLDAQIALVRSEFEVRRQEIQKLIDEAKQLGLGGEAEKLTASFERLRTLEQQTVNKTTTEFNETRTAANEQKINDLLSQRQTALDTINTLQEAGILTQSEAGDRIAALNERMLPQLTALALKAREFITTLGASPEAAAALVTLENLEAQIQAIGTELTRQQQQVIGVYTQGLTSGFMETATLISDLLKGVEESGNAWQAFGDIVLNTIADILTELAQMIVQQAIFNALKSAAESGSGGGWGAIINAVAGYLHTGGVVGSGAGRRAMVPAFAFAGATEYHTGGVAGFAADEVPAVLKRNEEVLTENDPRHRFNGGMDNMGGSAAPIELSVINTIDSESVVSAGANTRAGRKAIFNAIKADRASFKKLLD